MRCALFEQIGWYGTQARDGRKAIHSWVAGKGAKSKARGDAVMRALQVCRSVGMGIGHGPPRGGVSDR